CNSYLHFATILYNLLLITKLSVSLCKETDVMQKLVVCFLAAYLGYLAIGSAQQEVKLIKLDALEERLANGGDTTYVVNLWATWCEPCVAELPYFEQLQQTHSAQPLKIILLSLDAPKNHERVVKFGEKNGLRNEV